MQFLGKTNDFTVAITPTSIPQLDLGADNNTPTNGVFGLGVGVVAATDFGLVTDVRAAVSDWGLVTDAITTTIDLGVIGS